MKQSIGLMKQPSPGRLETLDELMACASRLVASVIREDGQMDHPVIFAIDGDGGFGILPVPTPRSAEMAEMMIDSLSGLLQGLGVSMYVFCMEGWMRNAVSPQGEPLDGDSIEVVLITGQSATEEATLAFPMLRDRDGAFAGLSEDVQRMRPSASELGAWGRLLRGGTPKTVH